MGESVSFFCECGFEGSSRIGGGMNNFKEVCLFPCYCKKCKDIIEINLYSDMKCKKCTELTIAYTDPSLIGSSGEFNVTRWGDLEITSGNYKCPKCGEMSLHFKNIGLNFD